MVWCKYDEGTDNIGDRSFCCSVPLAWSKAGVADNSAVIIAAASGQSLVAPPEKEARSRLKRRKSYNPKRLIDSVNRWPADKRTVLAERARYGGNPEHKSRPN